MRIWVAGALATTATICGAQSADRDPRDVTLAWAVVPSLASADPISARPGDTILRQQLVPLGYATLASEAVDAKTGYTVAQAGTPLLQLQANSGVVFCTAADPKKTALASAKPGSPYLRACFQDADHDGQFESSTEYDGKALPLPSVSGRLPKNMHALVGPVAYKKEPREAYRQKMFIEVHFVGFSGLGGEPVFKDAFGHDDLTGSLNRSWPRSENGSGALSKIGIVLLDGARISVLESDGKTLKVRVDNTIPGGFFAVREYRSNHFF